MLPNDDEEVFNINDNIDDDDDIIHLVAPII